MLVSLVPGRAVLPGRVEIRLAEHVVHLDARAWDDDARPAPGRGGERGRVPARVHDADVRRRRDAGELARCESCRGARRCRGRPDLVVGQEPPGGAAAVEVGHEARAPQPGGFSHRLGGEDDRLSAPGRRQRAEPVEDAERERDQEAAGRRRRVGDELGAAVGGADGPAPDDSIAGEVGLGHRSSALSHGLARAAGELTAVEGGRSFGRQPFERPGEVVHHDPLALGEMTVATVDPPSLRLAPEDDVEDLVEKCLAGVEGDAGAGELDRRGEKLGPGQPRVPPVRRGEPGRHPGNRNCRGSDVEDLRRPLVEGDVDGQHLSPLPGRQPVSRNRGEEVEEAVDPVLRPVDEHEASPARAGEGALGDPGDKRGGDAGIHGVPTLGEDPRARLGCQRVACGHGALHGERVAPGIAAAARGRSGSWAARADPARRAVCSPGPAGRCRWRSPSPRPGRRAARRSSRRR